MYYFTDYSSPLGRIRLAGDGELLKGLWFHGQKYFEANCGGKLIWQDSDPLLRDAARWLDAYFEGKAPSPSLLPLSPEGTEFQQRVWKLLRDIPYGETLTYGELSRLLGYKRIAAQAVGGAVGRNPISIIIPCHRVIGTDGSLTGYAGGIHIKQRLLLLEGNKFTNDDPPRIITD